MNLEKTLEEFGLEKSKGSVYLAALAVGTGSAQDVAKKAELPRTTAHEILQQLVGMGLVNFITKGRSRIYSVEHPEKLKKIFEERKRKLDAVLPELSSLFNIKGTRPRVRFYDGAPGVRTVFDDTLTVKDKKLYGILSMADLYKIPGKAFMDDYVEKRVRAGIRLRVIRSAAKEIEETWPTSAKENREMHYAPAEMIFPMTIYIYDNKVGIIGTEKENFGMIIESEEFFQTLKNLFEVLWQVTRVGKRRD
ncbi:helix-turn-helix domain-containing protein [Candidatus Uhrbacteria bacterium]|nr:helix-turn-helix domain-containing protein [Candidatus Uhrbacteria bacterium]